MFDLAEARAVLERTPAALHALLAGLPAGWVESNEGPDTFSPLDVVGHLLSGEEHDWIPRLRTVLEHGETRPFQPFDRFSFRDRLAGVGIEERLDSFAAARAASLGALSELALTEEDLDRRGTHPDFGSVTARQLLATWVVHDLGHLAQIARVMSKRYARAVGPWEAYLPILGAR